MTEKIYIECEPKQKTNIYKDMPSLKKEVSKKFIIKKIDLVDEQEKENLIGFIKCRGKK